MLKRKSPFVTYLGRKVPLDSFRVYVYNKDGKLLVNSYNDYLAAIESGKWFSTKEEIPAEKPKKAKTNDANSERIC